MPCRQIILPLLVIREVITVSLIIAICCGLEANTAAAQVPDAAQPGAIDRQLQEKPDLIIPPKETALPQPPRIKAPDGAENILFTLKDLIINGSTVYDPKVFVSIFGASIDKEISLQDVYKFASQITKLYQEDGFLFSYAAVPAQQVEEGIVTIYVIEGGVNEVDFTGVEHNRSDLINAWKKQILDEQPVNKRTIEKILHILSDITGMKSTPIYKPIKIANFVSTGRLTFELEQEHWHRAISLNNRGTRYVGPFQQIANITSLNNFGYFEEIKLTESTSLHATEMRHAAINLSVPIANDGTSVSLSLAETFSRPGFSVRSLDIKSHTTKISASITHPLSRTALYNWNLTGQFNYYNSVTDILSAKPNSQDKIRSLIMGTNYSGFDFFDGYFSATTNISQGLNILGETGSGSNNLSRANGRSDYTKIDFNFQRLQQIIPNINMLFLSSGQYGFSQVLSSEEFSYGGSTIGRAYESSEISGDSGIAGLVELEYTGFSKTSPTDLWFSSNRIYSFYDYGASWQRDSNQTDDRATGSSAGVGLRSKLLQNIDLELEAAKPLTRKVTNDNTDDKDVRFFLSVSSIF